MKTLIQSVLLLFSLISTMTVTAQVPLLSSNPSASAVIFLDFDGHTVNGTSWNYAGPIACGASGLDNTQLTAVFNSVAEDYRPFNVNVTTDSTKYLAAPAANRMRAILTVTSAWYGSAGGVAFVGSFIWGDDTPCFIFSALLGNNLKFISEATSHEVGHTLGLYHQSSYDVNCVKTSDYNYGTGAGEIGWAPIMGVGYYKNLTQWYNGPNSYGCTNYQSDLDILTTSNGFSYRTDDYDATFGLSTSLPFVSNRFNIIGMIERNTDQDMFKFVQPTTGRFLLNAAPYNLGSGNAYSNLDLQVTLYNSSQTQLNVYNPATLLNSVIDTSLNPGTYYLKIEGKGNAFASNYATLGSYSLSASFTGGTLPLRRLELKGEQLNDKHKLTWLIDADEAITKQILEVSTDGRNFSSVTQSPNNLRSYIYKPYVSTTAQYRMNVTFDNGHQYYSNIVSLRNTGSVEWPKLVNNITNNNIVVTSPGAYGYTVYEFSGKTVSKGQVTNGLNTINTSAITGGMYFIRFANGSEQWIDKFVKQ